MVCKKSLTRKSFAPPAWSKFFTKQWRMIAHVRVHPGDRHYKFRYASCERFLKYRSGLKQHGSRCQKNLAGRVNQAPLLPFDSVSAAKSFVPHVAEICVVLCNTALNSPPQEFVDPVAGTSKALFCQPGTQSFPQKLYLHSIALEQTPSHRTTGNATQQERLQPPLGHHANYVPNPEETRFLQSPRQDLLVCMWRTLSHNFEHLIQSYHIKSSLFLSTATKLTKIRSNRVQHNIYQG